MKIKEFINKNKKVLSFLLLLLSISLFCLVFLFRESDYFWHIKTGEYMFNNGITKKDVFSWFARGKYWMSHEWLFEIIIYSLSIVFKSYHIIIYGFVCIFILLLILFFSNKNNFFKNVPFSLVWILCSFILMPFMQARPHLISFNLLALTIWFLYDLYNNENSKKIYFLPIITVVWANVHGGSSNLSYLFCLLFIIGGLFSFKFSKIEVERISKLQLKKYFIVMILCMIAVCINIHGFKMFIYPYSNMSDTVMIKNISEWQPTTLTSLSGYVYYAFLIFIFFIMLFSKKKINFMDLLLFGVCAFLGIKSIRFWGYTYIVSTFIIFNYIDKRKDDSNITLAISLLSILLIILSCCSMQRVHKNLNKRYLNDEVISIIKDSSIKKLFNMYDYGGELIYNDIDVFIDGRADLYTNLNYRDYLNISTLSNDYIKLIDKYNFDYFLVSNKYPIRTYLKYSKDYELIYGHKEFELYKKID